MTRTFYGHDSTGKPVLWHKPSEPRLKVSDFGNSFIAYLSERTEDTTEVEVEVMVGEGDDAQSRTFTVDDSEPLDVFGLIFSRIFDEMGITLSDPGDFSWTDLSVHPNNIDGAYEVEINCAFTEE